ncbi:Phosphoribosylformylglycinamidine cyclo-ligase [subsurface metagenome]
MIGALYGIAEKRLFNQPETAGLSTEFIDIAGIRAYSRPALVFSMDGVGTKTKLGIMMKKTDGLALDIIHHSLNDILCQGAKGIAMMFYIGCNTLDRGLIHPFVKVVKACQKDDGFRTLSLSIAENRDLYIPGEYDICASIAGLVDSERLIQGSGVMAGDQIIGLASSGLHTNGYSLARKALLEKAGLKLEQHMHELGAALGEVLLIPHKNYVPVVMPLLQDEEISKAVKGIAHITGGGLQDNLARILPYGLGADIQKSSWQPQSIFAIIRKSGNIPYHDPVHKGMYETFNMGIGMAVIVDKEKTDQVSSLLHSSGEEARIIGRVVLNAAESAQERIRLLS